MGSSDEIRLLLCGDVMLGRGIDQVLPCPGDPLLPASLRKGRDARIFVALAELMHGALPPARGPDYVWGEALEIFESCRADVRIVNLETAVTARGRPWPDKPVHYRMHPANVDVLLCGGIDLCALANNHTLDFGAEGLLDTLETLRRAGIGAAGAGRDRPSAAAPAVLDLPGRGRVVMVSLATPSSGVPLDWGATPARPGVNLVGVTDEWCADLCRQLAGMKQPGDLLVVSIHWGDNYFYRFADSHRSFVQRLIDEGGADVIHGHSSHHVRGIEVHHGRPILYGCGDLINDYEGLLMRPRRVPLAPDLGLVYLLRFSAGDHSLLGLEMYPTRMRRLQLRRAGRREAARLAELMNREGTALGSRVVESDGMLRLAWNASTSAAPGG